MNAIALAFYQTPGGNVDFTNLGLNLEIANIEILHLNGVLVSPDSTPPEALMLTLDQDTGISSTDGITMNRQVNVSGIEAEATWQYSLDGGNTWMQGVGDSFLLDENTTYQEDDIQAKQTDAANNESPISSMGVIVIDNTAPSALTLGLADDTSGGEMVTSDDSLTITGEEPEATIEYSTDGGATWDESFSAQEGANSVWVRQVDVAGNAGSPSNQLNFTLDTMAPTISITTPIAEDNILGGNELNSDLVINGTTDAADGRNVTVTLTASGGMQLQQTGIALGGMFEVTFAATEILGMPDGTVNVDASVSDQAGNVGSAVAVQFEYDTTPPQTPLTLSLQADTGESTTDGITNDNTINVTGLDGGDTDNWQYSLDGGGTWSAAMDPGIDNFELADNTTYEIGDIQVRHTDAVGNVSISYGMGSEITTDNTAPVFGAQENPASTVQLGYDINNVLFTVLATDANLGTLPYDIVSGNFSIALDTGEVYFTAAPTTAGPQDVTVSATDLAGNTTQVTYTVQVDDGLAIDITSNAPDPILKNTPAVTFTFSANYTLDLTALSAPAGIETMINDGDIVINNGEYVADSFMQVDAKTFTIQVMTTEGIQDQQLDVSLAAGVLLENETGNGYSNAYSSSSTPVDVDTLADIAIGTINDSAGDETTITAITVDGSTQGIEAGQTVKLVLEDNIGTELANVNVFVDAAGDWNYTFTGLNEPREDEYTITASVSDTSGNFVEAEYTPIDPIVIFNLTTGNSSNHSDRIFQDGVEYDIYIVIDGDQGASELTWDNQNMWSGADNLSSDDTVYLVDNSGEPGGIFNFNNSTDVTKGAQFLPPTITNSRIIIWGNDNFTPSIYEFGTAHAFYIFIHTYNLGSTIARLYRGFDSSAQIINSINGGTRNNLLWNYTVGNIDNPNYAILQTGETVPASLFVV